MKKVVLASLACAMLAFGLTGCPNTPGTAGDSTGNGGTSNSTN